MTAPELPATTEPLSIYLHLPFCRQRCSYCDFNIYTALFHLQEDYSTALVREIALVGGAAHRSVHSVYFGGGTPSLTPLAQVAALMAALRQHFALTADCEITFEVNPGGVTTDYLVGLAGLGINRVSVGMQSARADELALFNRDHQFADVVAILAALRGVGFANISLDLIYGLPGQTLAAWQETLTAALPLQPEHLSIYALSLAFGTPLGAQVAHGDLPAPDDDLAADMYEWTAATLTEAGFRHYELSNWARADVRRDLRSRHNLQYWRYGPWLGLGAGAHGHLPGLRYSNVRGPTHYIRRITSGAAREFPLSPAAVQVTRLSEREQMGEFLMMGLRLIEDGIERAAFADRYGVDLLTVYGEPLARLAAAGLLAWDENATRLRLTPRGWLLSNRVFRELI